MKINSKALIRIYSMLMLIEGLAILPCHIVAKIDNQISFSHKLVALSAVLIVLGALFTVLYRNLRTTLKPQEGFFIASTSWVFCSLIGTIPFLISDMDCNFISALFESVAGCTTTGSSVLETSSMPRALLLWRAILNWLGGMGILVFIVSVFPALGISGQSIASTETTGPTLQKTGARFSDTGKFLYLTYISFTILEFILLSFSGMKEFTCLINTLSSISTGGLFITAEEKVAFDTTYVKLVITLFTLLSSINYTLYYLILKGKIKLALKNFELRIFLLIIAISTFAVAISLTISKVYGNFLLALENAFFQVVSFISTSGYFVSDYTSWPSFTLILLFTLLFIGGCSMSTSGSLKVIRIIVLAKLTKRGVFKMIHPNSVKAIVVQNQPIPAKKVSEITSHIFLYMVCFLVGTVLLAIDNFSLEETITASLGIFTNTGLSLSSDGMVGNFSLYSGFSKLIMCVLMILGRLEMYSLLLLFTKSFWNPDKGNRV